MRILILLVASIAIAIACSDANGPKSGALGSIKITAGASQTAPEGATLPDSIVVVATDSNGKPAVAVPVIYGPSGGGTTPFPSILTDNSGRAATTWTLASTVGQQNMLVTVQDPKNQSDLLTDTVYATATK